jgi:hypothetical protein
MYEPAIGDVVSFELVGLPCSGEVVELVGHNTVGVRVTEAGSLFEGQRIYFNAGSLQKVSLAPHRGNR